MRKHVKYVIQVITGIRRRKRLGMNAHAASRGRRRQAKEANGVAGVSEQ